MSGTFTALAIARDTAYWTGVSALAAWAALLVSAGGLAAVVVQLRANRAALRDTARSADAAAAAARAALMTSRPWIVFHSPNHPTGTFHPELPESRVNIEIDLVAHNIGQTPAVHPVQSFAWAASRADADLQAAIDTMEGGWAVAKPTIFHGQEVSLGLGTVIPGAREIADFEGKVLVMRLTYGMAGSPDRFTSTTAFELLFHPLPNQVPRRSNHDVPLIAGGLASEVLAPT